MALSPGTRVGPYEILAPLGKGGMGEVYRARDLRLGREVAIKVLPAEVARDEERLRRFELEARAASTLNHPNILTVHDVGVDAGVPYLVTELLQGETLRDLLRRGPVPLDRATAIVAHVSKGLAAAHREGIVHRDLKPENLFITTDGVCKILDFGLAKMEKRQLASGTPASVPTENATVPGMMMGTAGYMAPEQVRGEVADARSDLFSLGVVLYEMLAGSGPFIRNTIVESHYAILKEDPAPIAPPTALDPIVERCLEKDPSKRFQSSTDLAFALENPSGMDRAPRAAPRPRRTRWVVAAAALLAAAASVFALRARHERITSAGSGAIRSLAIFPFSSPPQDDYFSAGMTDVLTTELGHIAALKVIAHNWTAHIKDATGAAHEIARKLGADALVSGSIRREGDRVRVSAQIADTRTNRVLWSRTFDSSIRDALSLQGEVAGRILAAVALQLSPAETGRLGRDRAVNPQALDEYLKGRFLWTRRTETAVRGALLHFQAAVDLAPDFALGHVGVADAYIILAAYNWMEPLKAAPIALAAVAKAIALDPAAGEPHASRGDLAYHVDHDFALAARELDRAIELSPDYATAYHWRAEVSMATGHTDEAIGFLQRSLELDPTTPFPTFFIAFGRELKGQLEEAARGYRYALELSPGSSLGAGALVRLELTQGKTVEATTDAQHAVDVDPSAENLATLAVAFSQTGRPGEARAILARMRDLARQKWVSPFEIARVEAALGDRDAAIADLRAAIDARDFRMPKLKVNVDLEFRRLAGDPEFVALVSGIGTSPVTPR